MIPTEEAPPEARLQREIASVAIVGAGPAGVAAYIDLCYRGLSSEEIAVFDATGEALSAWQRSAGAILQRGMRSESEGHFFPTDFPGFALVDALSSGSPLPLVRSAVNRYHPSLERILLHARRLARHFGLPGRIQPHRVVRLDREDVPTPHLVLYGEGGEIRARARHVFLAPGHGPLRWPDALAPADVRAGFVGVLHHAYEPKTYEGGDVVIAGSGMAAVTEWVNVLRAGGRVVALRRQPELHEQQLSAPRCAFGGPWLDRYHMLPRSERAAVLASLSHGTFPRAPSWRHILQAAEQDGRLTHRVATLQGMMRRGAGVSVTLGLADAGRIETVYADHVICATGFVPGWRQHELLRHLIDDFVLDTEGDDIILRDDCSIPIVSIPTSVVSVGGPLARWAFPAADSLAGMKYAARRFTDRVRESRGGPALQRRSWCAMVRAGWPQGTPLAGQSTGPCATH